MSQLGPDHDHSSVPDTSLEVGIHEVILENARAIEHYTEGMDMRGFIADTKTRDAVERCLERISETAARLGETAPELAPEPPWQQIISLGN